MAEHNDLRLNRYHFYGPAFAGPFCFFLLPSVFFYLRAYLLLPS